MGLSLNMPSCGGTPNIVVNVNHGGTDLTKLIYADNDTHAGVLGVALKGYYLASLENTLGIKEGTLIRRED